MRDIFCWDLLENSTFPVLWASDGIGKHSVLFSWGGHLTWAWTILLSQAYTLNDWSGELLRFLSRANQNLPWDLINEERRLVEICGFGVSESTCRRGVWGQKPKIIRDKQNLEIERRDGGEPIRKGISLDPDLPGVLFIFRMPSYIRQWSLFLAEESLILILAICNQGVLNNKHKKPLKNVKLVHHKVQRTFRERKILLFYFAFRLVEALPDSHYFLVSWKTISAQDCSTTFFFLKSILTLHIFRFSLAYLVWSFLAPCSVLFPFMHVADHVYFSKLNNYNYFAHRLFFLLFLLVL